MAPAPAQIKYPEMFAAVGRFISKKGLSEVCVVEFEHGVIVTGSILYETMESYNRRTETYVLSYEDLKQLMRGG